MNRTLGIRISPVLQLRFIIVASILWLACISLAWAPVDGLEILPVLFQGVIVCSAFAVIFCLPVPIGYLAFRLALTERRFLRDHVAFSAVAFGCATVTLTLYLFVAWRYVLRAVT